MRIPNWKDENSYYYDGENCFCRVECNYEINYYIIRIVWPCILCLISYNNVYGEVKMYYSFSYSSDIFSWLYTESVQREAFVFRIHKVSPG